MSLQAILRRHPMRAAFTIIGAGVLVALLLQYKQTLITTFTPGETFTIQFAENYQLREDDTPVKIAGSEIGRVKSVDPPAGGPVNVVVKVRHGMLNLLGSEPSATVRPTTLLGGKYYIDVRSGGSPGRFTAGTIPVERTRVPVELDKVLAAIPPDAQLGLRGMTERLDATLKAGAGAELKNFVKDAPATLRPAGVVLDGLRGVNKDGDLAILSTTGNITAQVLTAKPGQLRAVIDSLAVTAKAFGDSGSALGRTIGDLPATLEATRQGAADLSTTLDKLVDTADDARPTARKLNSTMKELDPALDKLNPMARELRPVLDDARPLLDQLAPTVERGYDVLNGAQGKPLDRVNGTMSEELNREWRAEGPKFPKGGRDGAKFYQELAYFFTNFNGSVMKRTKSSHVVGFNFITGGPSSVMGFGNAVDRLQVAPGELSGVPHQAPGGGTRNPDLLVPGTGQGFGIPTPPGPRAPTINPNAMLDKGTGK